MDLLIVGSSLVSSAVEGLRPMNNADFLFRFHALDREYLYWLQGEKIALFFIIFI